MGRPSLYSHDLAERILDRLAQGESLVQICSDGDMPGLRTVMRWAGSEDFGTEYTRAREAQAEFMDHKILQAADAANDGNAAAQRVKVDAYKWRAAKLAPKRYGDRITHAGDETAPLQIATITRRVVDPQPE